MDSRVEHDRQRVGAYLRPRIQASAVAIVAIALGYFFVWPLLAIIGKGLVPEGHLHLGVLLDVVRDNRLRHVIAFTTFQASVSALLVLVVGMPLAFVLERQRPHGAALVRTLVFIPFALPTVVVGAAFAAWFGGNGPGASLHLMHTTTIIVIAHVYFNIAVVVRIVGSRWRLVDPNVHAAARVLGANRVRAFVHSTLPALAPAIVGATAIVWLFCVTSFGVIVTLGGGSKATLETEIFRLTTQELDLRRAGALLVVQLVAVAATLVVAARIQRIHALTSIHASMAAPPAGGSGLRRAVRAILLATVGVVMLLPIAIIVQRAIADGGAGFGFLRDDSVLGWRPIDSVATSLQTAAWSTGFALTFGVVASVAVVRRWPGARIVSLMSALPLGISAVSIGFGFLIALDRPIDLRQSWVLVPIAQATVALPFVLRTVIPVLQSIQPAWRDAAAVLGASPTRVVRSIDVAIASSAIATAAAFAFVISLGEFGATSFLARAATPTMPIAIVRLLGRPGTLPVEGAYALATVMIGLIAAVATLMGLATRRTRVGLR